VHGTCLGFEALAIIVSRNTSVLSDMDALNAPSALLYTEDADSSEWLRALPPHLVKNMQVGPLTFENHAHGVLTTAYEENAPLKSFFKVLALSLDNTGLPYISMMEARKVWLMLTGVCVCVCMLCVRAATALDVPWCGQQPGLTLRAAPAWCRVAGWCVCAAVPLLRDAVPPGEARLRGERAGCVLLAPDRAARGSRELWRATAAAAASL
jgi:hypothetical protein